MKLVLMCSAFILAACGVSSGSSEVESLRTPHGFYETLNDYSIASDGFVKRVECVSRWDRDDVRCDQLEERVSKQALTRSLQMRGVKDSEIESLFQMMTSPQTETVRISDTQRTPELRLAAGYLEQAFLDAGKGFEPYSLSHNSVKYIETFKPTLSFSLSGRLSHRGEIDLYTYNFYIQDGTVYSTASSLDFGRPVCRLSSVGRIVDAGLWKFRFDSLVSLRFTFENRSSKLSLSCGVLSRTPDRERGHLTDQSATLLEMKTILGGAVQSFQVVR